jgi:transcriptional regulator with XRE-family HTH domain
LVLAARKRQAQEIKRIRRKLGLSQTAATRLTGGGHDAFSRYERGEAAPACRDEFVQAVGRAPGIAQGFNALTRIERRGPGQGFLTGF